jgi:integrase
MAVRKRSWRTAQGEIKEAWVVDYVDQSGERHIQTFDRKKEADAYHASVKVDVRQGIHTAPSKSKTVAEAGKNWLKSIELEGRERTTLDQYRQHLDLHIVPRIGNEKLAALTTPRLNTFRDELLSTMSRTMARKVMSSLKSLLKDAQGRGDVAQNVALAVKGIKRDSRAERRLEIGRDIPTTDEIKAMLAAAEPKTRPLLITAVFTGLRSSELRGLRWCDVDLKRGELHVRQRADRYGVMGDPKSESGHRTIPLGPMVINVLREWKLASPKGKHDLIFPTPTGGISLHNNVVRALTRSVRAAGLTVDGKPKYTGPHALRHFFASWCINPIDRGGQGLQPKVVQTLLGHSTLAMTTDTYGHLFPADEDAHKRLTNAERELLG